MGNRLTFVFLAAAFGAAAMSSPAAAPAARPSPAVQQCRWNIPAQFGPRAAVRAAARSCPAAARRQEACGRYELYWPHWLSQRALPPVRRWVAERC